MTLTSNWIHGAAAGVVAVLLFGSGADAADLNVGSKAPAIDIAHWIQTREGMFTPVTEFAPGKVYVIEFWATWCGPCVKNMPHLATLQDAYVDKGVTIIGVSDEEPDTISTFLTQDVDGKATYADITKKYCLTTDPDGSVKKDYYDAAGENGIPVAFIVGKTGEIEWIGHPMEMGEPLEATVAGTWDRAAHEAFVKEAKVYQKRLEPISELLQGDDPMRAVALVDELIADCSNERIKKQLMQMREGVSAMAAKSEALLTLKKTLRKGGPEATEAFGRFVATADDSAGHLIEAAWAVVELVDQEKNVSRDLLAAARAAAEKAVGPSPENFMWLHVLVRLQTAQGDIEKAIATQKKVLGLAAENTVDAEASMRRYLESLEAKAKP